MVPRTKMARAAYTRRRAREDLDTRARVARAESERKFWEQQIEANRVEAAAAAKRDAEINERLADTQKRIDRMITGAGMAGVKREAPDPLRAEVLRIVTGEFLDDPDKALAAETAEFEKELGSLDDTVDVDDDLDLG